MNVGIWARQAHRVEIAANQDKARFTRCTSQPCERSCLITRISAPYHLNSLRKNQTSRTTSDSAALYGQPQLFSFEKVGSSAPSLLPRTAGCEQWKEIHYRHHDRACTRSRNLVRRGLMWCSIYEMCQCGSTLLEVCSGVVQHFPPHLFPTTALGAICLLQLANYRTATQASPHAASADLRR
ncbi:hypothetical protein IG631_05660 [Alternaria alternata]|nr:hypothetical protein IG631_05660 [Alternaria alternata]